MLEEVLQEGVRGLGIQPGQSLGISGVAGLRPPGLGHLQLVEQNGLELLGAGEVELAPGSRVGALGRMSHAAVKLGLTGCEHRIVDSDTRVLHDGEGCSHGHLQVGEEPHGVPGRHLRVEHGLNRKQDGGSARAGQVRHGHCVRGEGLQVEGALRLALAVTRVRLPLSDGCQVDAEPALGEGVDVVAALLGPAQVAGQ